MEGERGRGFGSKLRCTMEYSVVADGVLHQRVRDTISNNEIWQRGVKLSTDSPLILYPTRLKAHHTPPLPQNPLIFQRLLSTPSHPIRASPARLHARRHRRSQRQPFLAQPRLPNEQRTPGAIVLIYRDRDAACCRCFNTRCVMDRHSHMVRKGQERRALRARLLSGAWDCRCICVVDLATWLGEMGSVDESDLEARVSVSWGDVCDAE